MKTLKAWEETELNLTAFLQPGDEVDEAMVEYFMNVMPPCSMGNGYLQVGEAYSHIVDKDGKWIYKGVCFAGQTENRIDTGDPRRREE